MRFIWNIEAPANNGHILAHLTTKSATPHMQLNWVCISGMGYLQKISFFENEEQIFAIFLI